MIFKGNNDENDNESEGDDNTKDGEDEIILANDGDNFDVGSDREELQYDDSDDGGGEDSEYVMPRNIKEEDVDEILDEEGIFLRAPLLHFLIFMQLQRI